METPAHIRVGTATVLASAHGGTIPALAGAHWAPLPLPGLAVALLVAAATSGGPLSPDMDNQPWFKRLDKWTPDEVLGGGGPFAHRGILHSWMLPAALWTWWTRHPLPAVDGWAVRAMITVWLAHDLADWVFGEEGCGHGRGIPLVLWFQHHGWGLAANSRLERAAGHVAALAGLYAAVTLLPPLTQFWP
jgi:hypothetical protein